MSGVTAVFVIAVLGYALGSVSIKKLSLGTSGVLIVALVFGHYGIEIPAIVRNFGLALFVGSVGLISGPVFFRNFKKQVYAFLVIGTLIVVSGALVTMLLGKAFSIPFDLAIGMFSGALTSTPGLAAATEATEMVMGNQQSMASIGYGIAYPFGVVGVVLFVQLVPKILKADIQGEAEALRESMAESEPKLKNSAALSKLKEIYPSGFFALTAVLAVGVMFGSIKFPLPGGMKFSFGTAGGPLFSGLILGHFGRIGKISLKVPMPTLKSMRELGLCLFLIGAGTDAGAGFVAVLKEYGWVLFAAGAIITLIPMILACVLARRVMKLDTLSMLGSVCGGMTSTPALGALISSTGVEEVATSYAATYPFALIFMVLGSQIMALIW